MSGLKTVEVSVETYGQIWSLREGDEKNEEDILARVVHDIKEMRKELSELKAEQGECKGKVAQCEASAGIGVYEQRKGVTFPEGFEVFWEYKHRGKEGRFQYRAVVSRGMWQCTASRNQCLEDRSFNSINGLTKAVLLEEGVTTNGVAWRSLRYEDGDCTYALGDFGKGA